ncbi:RHS repeat-associated core domain-containing protein [Amycolatopsis umgeniensis]|uniref:RHS repeat-associated protein n=1 Tax=Amycolatopsis umgeniensis TaxID=336628 RepID=A0A841BHB4_9PSEU|nr:RHS repeat-associated protein [Amycolatopsis umgeniensis]
MSNPLVAPVQDSTTAVSGIPLLEGATELKTAIESKDWAGVAMGAVGTALDALTMAMDPVGAVFAAGVGWLIEHVGPLKEALNALTGNADEIAAQSETWTNIAKELGSVSAELVDLVEKDLQSWHGDAADAYRKQAENTATLIASAQKGSEGAASGVKTAGEVVAAVRTLVRDIIAELVGHLISWALQVVFTLGIGMTWVVPQVVAAVAKTASKIASVTTKLVKALKALAPLLKKAGTLFDDAGKALKGIRGGKPKAPPKPKDIDSSKGSPGKDGNSSGDSTTTSSADPGSTNTAGTGGNSGGSRPHGETDQGGKEGPGGAPPPGRDPSGGNNSTSASGAGPGVRGNSRGPRQDGVPDKNKNTCGDPIDVAGGDVVLAQTDVELAAALSLVLRRVHLSSYRAGWSFGPNWASTVDQRLEIDGEGVSFACDDGTLLFYPHPMPQSLPQAGPRRPLALTGEGYTVTLPEEGRTLHFGGGTGVLPLHAITDRNGHRIDFVRDDAGVPTEIRHSGGYRIRVESAGGMIRALHLCGADDGADLLLLRYGYEHGRLTEVTNASGTPLRFSYDGAGRMTGWTDRNGAWYRYGYDSEGRVVRAEGSGGFLSGTMAYEGTVRRWTNSLGQQTVYHLNELGQTVREIDPAGHEVRSEWDAFDRLLSRTDPLGRTVRYEHDEFGNVVAVTRPDGSQTRLEHNGLGLPVTMIAADGTVSRREYDERGNLTRVIDAAGRASGYGYDEQGNLSTITDPLGGVRTILSNDAGLPVSVTDPSGAVTRYERDGFGRVCAVVDPAGATTRFGWTVDGLPAWETSPEGTTQRWIYDGEGNLRTYVDALGQIHHTEVTHADLPSAETRPDGTRMEYGYDTELRLTSVTNQQGLVWRYEYDAAGDLVRETDFNGRVLTYRHDAAGQLVERVNGVGETAQFRYDVLGRVVERRNGAAVTTFAYDAAGRVIEATNPDARVTFTRDLDGRVLTETVNGRTVASAYDPLGRLVRRRTPSGAESVWDYDAGPRPVSLHTAGRTLRFAYDSAGNETRREWGSQAVLAQSWDAAHRLRSQSLTDAAGTETQRRSYRYREDGFLTAMDDRLTGPRRFDLDRVGRVVAVSGSGWSERYAYDAAGNVAHASWPTSPEPTAEELGAREYRGTLIRRAGNVRYEHDAQGRVVLRQRKRLSRRPDTWRYFWNSDDCLSEVLTPDGTRWRYRYDALGRRIAKQRLTLDGSGVLEQIEFAWDGLVLAEQAHTVGVPNGTGPGDARVTVWNCEPGTGRPLTQTERSPLRHAPQQWIDERFYSIITDLVGTPTELVDDRGDVAWFHRTTLWGATALSRGGAGTGTPLRFPGQYHDPETGFNYNVLRHYDPDSARYGSADPIGLRGGANPHQYVPNPHTWLDPLGLTPCQEQLAADLGDRASYYHRMLNPRTGEYNTVSVIRVRDSHGNEFNVVTQNGGDDFTRAQRGAAQPGDLLVRVPGGVDRHAEMNGMAVIRNQGWTPIAGGASRPVCTPCGTTLWNQHGAQVVGPEFLGEGTGQTGFIFPLPANPT